VIEAGDIYLADSNEDRRLRVLVVSNERFHRLAGRVLVAPELALLPGDVTFPWRVTVDLVAPELALLPGDVTFPWRVTVDDTTFAVDLLRSVPAERLLERVDRAPAGVVKQVEQVLRHIT